jgi:hypothetical protein
MIVDMSIELQKEVKRPLTREEIVDIYKIVVQYFRNHNMIRYFLRVITFQLLIISLYQLEYTIHYSPLWLAVISMIVIVLFMLRVIEEYFPKYPIPTVIINSEEIKS